MMNFRWRIMHIDFILLFLLILLSIVGLFILYSASNENTAMVESQALRLGLGFLLMIVFAQISPHRYQQWSLWLYLIALLSLFAVLVIGHVGQGARRWIDLKIFRFQPSEIMTLAMPMMLAWFISQKSLPPRIATLLTSSVILIVPALLVAKQPDLGTAIIIFTAGLCVVLLAGLNWRIIVGLLGLGGACTPILWHFMHTYQKLRVLTFLNPERDPLGSGYHIIQSKIAIGSGGVFGKGWLQGTQSHLSFLPAHATDFIFAVSAEEFGFIGCCAIILLFLLILVRCLYISSRASDNFTRLLSGSLSLVFIISAFINIGMVIGVLPVVGVPLPLISYGGSSIVTMMISFGIIMSIHTHKKLWPSS
ncbi:MAG: rod shape-determining protein RodA [Gammaproteobacteria bacterium]|nr:rod shape-determining protein RodA [Gammaproteobacteria bacterium]MCH9743366.1 rod shape-determining protein RodA [Gammaproteobacteria bacterium]